MSNNRFPIKEIPLPTEILIETVAPHFNKKTIANVRRVNKPANRLFAPVSDVARLLDYVKVSDYDAAEKLVKQNPQLMFKYISYKTEDNKEDNNKDNNYEIISPLKLAAKSFDTYMWHIFLQAIIGCKPHILQEFPEDLEKYKNSHILISEKLYFVNEKGNTETVTIKNYQLFKRFLNHIRGQKDHINLDDVFAEYTAYDNLYRDWRNTISGLTFQDLEKRWLKLALKIRLLIPIHIFKEFCRVDDRSDIELWNEKSDFDVVFNQRPGAAKILNPMAIGYRLESLLPFIPDVGLGYEYGIVRGNRAPANCVKVSYETYRYDMPVLRHLYQVRRNDLSNLLYQIEPVAKNLNRKSV